METLAINLNHHQLTEPANIGKLLNHLFVPHTGNYNKLVYELQREFKWGGSPDVKSIIFDRVKYDETTGKGSFRILLDISFTFGCEDVITEKQDQTSEWTFEVDRTEMMMRLYSSPYVDSRSTADEF